MLKKEFPPADTSAIVVTYHPDHEAVGRLAAMLGQSGYLIVVDNGSSVEELAVLEKWISSQPNCELIKLTDNIGLAAALNRGLGRASDLGFRFAITYDQDSIPEAAMVATLVEVLCRHPSPESVAVIGPAIVDRNAPVEHYRWLRPNPRLPLLFERVSCKDGYRDDISFVITSGSLLSLDIFNFLGRFREDLFIDYVDHEYCLRARSGGYRIVAAGEARLLHVQGNKREVKLVGRSVRPTFHAVERLYYIYRNRIPLILEYGLREPHWLSFDILATTHNLLRVAVYENDRRRKLLAAAEGTVDGLLGKLGRRRSRWKDAVA